MSISLWFNEKTRQLYCLGQIGYIFIYTAHVFLTCWNLSYFSLYLTYVIFNLCICRYRNQYYCWLLNNRPQIKSTTWEGIIYLFIKPRKLQVYIAEGVIKGSVYCLFIFLEKSPSTKSSTQLVPTRMQTRETVEKHIYQT